MNTIKKIYIIDIFLTDYRGHYYAEAAALRDGAANLGLDAQIVGSPKLDKETARRENILPLAPDYVFCAPFVFRHLWEFTGFLRRNKNPIFAGPKAAVLSLIRILTSYWFEKPFDDFFRKLPDEPESLYLFQTASFFVINRILHALQKNKPDLKTVFSSHFKMNESEINEIMNQAAKLSPAAAPKFFWSSEIHVKEYHDMGFQAAKLLTIPQPGWRRYLNTPVRKNACLTLTFIGDSAYRKGFHLLPELIEKLRKYFPSQKFRFDIQYSPIKFSKRSNLIRSSCRRLQKMDVNLITGKLNSASYYDLLNRSDIILQPYQVDSSNPQYRYGGTSGILLEAMARGKIPVVPADTWLSAQVEKFNSGKIFSGNNDFFAKVIEAVNELDSLKAAAESTREYWSKLHNPEHVVKTILAN
ncbi:MAG: hypothetical protein PHV82_17645 [Victivallaceae bacterium]|nr:hypothetical protein [Victivallaceae bacterium]